MRYTGPKWRRARRLGFSLLGTGEKAIKWKTKIKRFIRSQWKTI